MSGLIIYALIALSISLTSYINIYKPAVELYEEVTEDEESIVNSIPYKIVWLVLAFIMAPFIGFMLLRGRNDNYIRDLVVTWIGTDEWHD